MNKYKKVQYLITGIKYQPNDFVDIDQCRISGVKNPRLNISGTVKTKGRIKVLLNDQVFNNKKTSAITLGDFNIDTPIPSKTKKIQLIINCKGKNHSIIVTKNKLQKRAFAKVQGILSSKLKKPKSIIIVLFKGIAFFWKEYRFLVPPKLWGKYYCDMLNRINERNSNLYFNPFIKEHYNKWLEKNEKATNYEEFAYTPLISILIPVYNIEKKYLSECLDSILAQKYENFEVCLADDNSTLTETIETLKAYEQKDQRIKVVYRQKNGHISRATNSALGIAKGEFVALMDNDDLLTENALYEMVKVLNKNKKLDMIYSDEDKLDMEGYRCEPHFKPDFSPDSLFGGNYICHFEILRKKIVDKIGGFDPNYIGAQDFDLFLRFIEHTTPDKIYHIPQVLYHWRKIPGSTADTIESKEYAIDAGKRAVEAALKRRKIAADVLVPINSTHYIVEYKYKKEPLVSILIPTKDNADILDKCLKSIYQKTSYKNFEIILINNNSEKAETFKLLETYSKKYENFQVVAANIGWNYSKINNIGVKYAKGEYLLFLNNDTEVITPTWINSMVGYAMQKHIGAVGIKLLYPDNTIQHGGVVLGTGLYGVATHAFINQPKKDYGIWGRLLVPYNYSAVTAACMMINKDKFKSIKGFEEKLAVAFNDIDLNLKLLKKGYYNVFLPQVQLYHHESKSRGLDSTSKKYKQLLKEVDYMQKKWPKELANDKFYNPNFSKNKCFFLDKKSKK